MRKRCTPIALIFLWSLIGHVEAQIYQVQIAAFIDPIEQSFFDYAGYPKVYKDKDYNNFTRYTLGEFFTKEQAEAVRRSAEESGFVNTHVIELDQPMFAYSGDSPQLPLTSVPEKEDLFIRSVEFKEEHLSLNKALLSSLEEALTVMQQQPNLRLRIVGYTDDIGEKAVNYTISKKRARIIQNFLLANGIPAYRLKMKISEAPSPAVYFKGKGVPQTRDYNRRIIMTLVDLKDEIVADTPKLKQEKKFQESLSVLDKAVQFLNFVKIV